jgi:hypothetical protein
MQVKEVGDNYVITIPKNKVPVLSSKEKTFLVSSSGGFIGTGLSHGDEQVKAMVVMTIPNRKYEKPAKA